MLSFCHGGKRAKPKGPEIPEALSRPGNAQSFAFHIAMRGLKRKFIWASGAHP